VVATWPGGWFSLFTFAIFRTKGNPWLYFGVNVRLFHSLVFSPNGLALIFQSHGEKSHMNQHFLEFGNLREDC
jgi:hypothetical protein